MMNEFAEGQFDGVINWTATPMKDDSKKGVIELTPALSDRQLSMSFRFSCPKERQLK